MSKLNSSIKIKSSKSACCPRKEFFSSFSGSDIDLRSVKILSRQDWERIQYNIHRKEIERAEQLRIQKEKEDLKQKSQDLVKNWTNTVLGARQKKLAEREARLAKEEEEKKKIDLDEGKFQSEMRKLAIEKAKVQQYYQTDRVKNFHSALLLTETLKERDAQLELKKLKEMANVGEDQVYVEKWKQEFEEALMKDQQKMAERIKKNHEFSTYQYEQMKKTHSDRERDKLEELAEGEQIRQLAQAHELEMQRLEQLKKDEQRQLMQNNLRQIEQVKKMREIEKLKEAEEDENCRLFAAAKKKMLRMRMERERDMYREKQETLDKIRLKLSSQLEAMINDEEDRTQNAIREREERMEQEEAEKRRRRDEMLASIGEHRQHQRQRRMRDQEQRDMEEMQAVRAKQKADQLFRENEVAKRANQLLQARRLAEYQLKQAEGHGNVDKDDRETELFFLKENEKLVESEEMQFQDYATRVIDHCRRNGRNVYPLERAAKFGAGGGLGPQLPGRGGVRPSYKTADGQALELPHYRRGTTEKVKAMIDNQENTANRLGFVWG